MVFSFFSVSCSACSQPLCVSSHRQYFSGLSSSVLPRSPSSAPFSHLASAAATSSITSRSVCLHSGFCWASFGFCATSSSPRAFSSVYVNRILRLLKKNTQKNLWNEFSLKIVLAASPICFCLGSENSRAVFWHLNESSLYNNNPWMYRLKNHNIYK